MKEILREIFRELAGECDYLEIRIEESENTNIVFEGPTLNQVNKSMEKGGFIRALYKGGWGEISFNDVDNIKEYAKSAIEQAKKVGKDKSILAPVPVVEDEVLLDLISDPRDVSFENKIELMRKYNDIVLNYHESIKSSNTVYFEKFTYIVFANSEGTYIYQEKMDLSGGTVAIAVDGQNRQSANAIFGSTNDFNVALNLENEIKKACKLAVDLLSAPKVKSGEYTIIADPKLAGIFAHEAFGHLSEADDLYGNENLKKVMSLGKELGKPILNIYDSGIAKGKRGSLVYDDEGVKTEKTYLIKNGKLVGRLHTRETAGKMNEKPTGNARAMSYKYPPICRMRTTCIEAGDAAFEDMIKDIELGILACRSRGGETNNEMFTFSAAYAYMIRKGKIAELIRDVNLSGNVFTTLKNIDMIGKDEIIIDGIGGCGKSDQFGLPISTGGPYIRIQNVVVGGAE